LRRVFRPDDRVVLFGENDRFHCPAALAWRDDYLPVAGWGRDPEAWRRGLGELHVTGILYREDRRGAEPLLEALRERLEVVDRQGRGVVYRGRRGSAAARLEYNQYRPKTVMTDPIVFRETTSEASPTAALRDAVAVRFDPSRRVLLRFEISVC